MKLARSEGVAPWLSLAAFCAGVIGHRFLDALVPVALVLLAVAACLVAALKLPRVRPVFAAVLGFAWANLMGGQVLESGLDADLEQQDVVVSGRIVGVPVQDGRYASFRFLVDTMELDGVRRKSPGIVRLRAYSNPDRYRAAQSWRLVVRLKQARSYQNPGSRFNYETWLFSNRIRAAGYIRESPTNSRTDNGENPGSIDRLREQFANHVSSLFPDRPLAGILSALAVGVRSSINDENWEVLQRTGTIHLVAISGLHIGMVSGAVLALSALCWRLTGQFQQRVPARTAAVFFGMTAGTGYALLAGFTIPTQRAVIMLAVACIAIVIRRQTSPAMVLVLALAAVLLIDPLATLASGFWLSFAAVAVLVWWACREPGRQPVQDRMRMGRWASKWIAVQLALFAGLAPFLIAVFQQVSLAAPIANLVAIPVIGMLVVPLALFALLSIMFDQYALASPMLELALNVLEYLWVILAVLSNTPITVWKVPTIPPWLLIMFSVGIILLVAPRALPGRNSAILWLLPLFCYSPPRMEHGSFNYTMLDVGHGLASVVETRHHVLVYDTGPRFGSGFDAGAAVLLPYLRSRGVQQVDTLIVSHGHNDHVGGMPALLGDHVPDRILGGEPEVTKNASLCTSGDQWTWDGVEFEILWPFPESDSSGNDASCVLQIRSPNGSLLLTGDIETRVERMLVEAYPDKLNSDVLQVPHQGSLTSSSRNFLEAVKPRIALFSTAYLNRYGHPHPNVFRRYRQQNTELYNTALDGAISVNYGAEQIVTTQRDKIRGYWLRRNENPDYR